MTDLPTSIDETLQLLADANYVADRTLATVLFLSLRLQRPLFLEGEAGVGKTEIAKVLSSALGRPLIRLQCYEGLDVSSAVYEWNYAQQMMAIRLAEASGETDRSRLEHDIFSERYLVKRALLRALEPSTEGAPILLIDELDRTDEAFEAFLLEVLSAYQVSVPELGVIKAKTPPLVFLTSNNVRDLGDALKRRCLHLHIPLPEASLEERIVATRVPGIEAGLTKELVAFVQTLRTLDLRKPPSISETVDWARALILLHADSLSPDMVRDTLNVILKFEQDIEAIEPQISELMHRR